MRFVHPEYLYFLLFALVPVILYFFNLQKIIKVDFSNVEMLEDVKRKTSNRFQLKRLFIMLSRLFFVAFIVLAFAQPMFDKTKNVGATHHVIYLDNSLSMTRKVDAQLLLDQAKVVVEKYIEDKKGDSYSFFTNSSNEIAKNYRNKKDLLKEVSMVQSSSYMLAEGQIEALLRRKKTELPKHYYIISDFQATRFSAKLKKIGLDEGQQLSLLALQGSIENIYIDSLWLDSKYLVAGNNFEVHFNLNNRSVEDKEVLVKCKIGNKQVGSKILQLEAGSGQGATIQVQLPKKGINKCVLTVEDELVQFDNDYHFVIEANKNIDVLLVKSKAQSFFASAYRNEPLFLVRSFYESNLNTSEILDVDMIVLEEVRSLNNLPIEQLKAFLEQGGHLVLVPHKNQSVKDLARFTSLIGLRNKVSTVTSGKETVDFNKLMSNRMYEGVFENTKKKIQSVVFNPKFTVLGGENIVESRKGNALLEKLRVGKGTLYLFSSSFEDSYTNFVKHSLFVPTSYQLALNSSQTNKNISYNIGAKSLVLEDVNPKMDENYALVSGETQYLPEQQINGKDLLLYLEHSEKSGFYDIRSANRKLTAIGLNYDREESDFEPFDLSVLNNLENIEVVNLDARQDLSKTSMGSEFQLWKLFVILALLGLLLETVLLRFFK